MANKLRGEVTFEARGVIYTLRLGVNELIQLQDAFGIEDDAAFLAELPSRMRGLRDLRKFFSVGLRRHHPDLTDEQVGDLMTELGLAEITKHAAEAMRWAWPEPPAGKVEPKPKKAPRDAASAGLPS